MKKQLLTDTELRARWSPERGKTYRVEGDVILTPAARDFVRENGIELCRGTDCENTVADAAPAAERADAPLYAGNPPVWDRSSAPRTKPVPLIPAKVDYAGNPAVWDRNAKPPSGGGAGYAGNPPVWRPDRKPASMTTVPVPTQNGKKQYRIAETGRTIDRKPEEMTHLRGNLLVPKTHPRIAFRGKLDSLMAKIIETQCAATDSGDQRVVSDLEDLLSFVRQILAAEVKDAPLPAPRLLGMTSEQLRDVSHNIQGEYGISHPIPDHGMGRLCAALNALRTQVRETELAAAAAFTGGNACSRPDLIEGLNRLSSAVYIVFCRRLSGWYDRSARP